MNFSKKEFFLCVFMCVFLVFLRCGGVPYKTKKSEKLTLPTIHLISSKDSEKGVLAVGNESDLLKQADRFFKEKKFKQAVSVYTVLLNNYPDSKYLFYYFYNRGLSFKKLGKFKKALTDFQNALKHAEYIEDKIDTNFQIGTLFLKLKEYEKCSKVFEKLSEYDVDAQEKIEILTNLGICLKGKKDYERALRYLKKAVLLFKEKRSNIVVNTFSLKSAAIAQFNIGEIYFEKFKQIKFKLPVSSMKESLNMKNRFFLKAQYAYLEAIRLGDYEVASAGTYRIGLTYEVFYHDIQNAELPPNITGELKKIYFNELKKLTKPLIERAIDIYKSNIKIAKKLGIDNKWIKISKQRLNKLRKLYELQFKESN